MIGIGLLGCGTVGSGVVKLLKQNQEIISRRSGCPIEIIRVLEKDKARCLALGLSPDRITQKLEDVIDDPDINIVVELIGGEEPAFTFIMAAMQKGKHVVTANKDLIAVRGKELFNAAAANNVDFYFEGSVGGGIPVIYPLKQSLAGNNIKKVIGILNGTTNYILTKMSRENRDFSEVLKQAQELGYAEADPTSDIEGLDAARKIAILSSIAFNSRITLSDVHIEGIAGIAAADIEYARELGYVVKLLAIAREETEGKVLVKVHPAFISENHPLAAVNDVFNAVFIEGDAVGDIMLYGRGAGQMPTASAVVGDIIEISRNMIQNIAMRIGCTCYDDKQVINILQSSSQFYIRMLVTDRPGVLAGIASVFGNNNVSIAAVIQKTRGDQAELILITHQVNEGNMSDALAVLRGMDIVGEISSVIRVEDNESEAGK